MAMVSRTSRPSASKTGMLPLPSELAVTRVSGRPRSLKAATSSSNATSGSPGAGIGSDGDVDRPARGRPVEPLLEQAPVARDVGGDGLGHRDLGLADEPEEELEAAPAVAEMEVKDAGLAAEHPADPALGREPGDLVEGRLRGAVVAHGDLAGPDDLVDEDEVGADAAGQGPDRDLVGPRKDERRDALGLEGPGLGQQRGHVAGDAVGAQAADDRRDPARDDVLDPDLRGAGGGPAFAAAAEDMDVGVDEPRDDAPAGRVDDLHLEPAGRQAPGLSDRFDDAARDEDVLPSERLRREHLSAAYQGHHGRLLRRVTGPKLARLSGLRKRARPGRAF